MQLADYNGGPGSFFKGPEYYEHAALLIEVLELERDRPGNFGPKDTIIANVHAFGTPEDVDNGKASYLQCTLIQGAIVRDLADLVGSATIVKTAPYFFKKAGKEGAVLRTVDPATKAKVADYAGRYFAKIEEESADAPPFDED